MVNKVFYSISFLTLFLIGTLQGQELNCNVTVHDKQVQSTNKHVFDNMREGIMEFMKNKSWTTDKFLAEERIESNYYFTINQVVTADVYEADIQISSVRPVYGTNYNSPMLNIKDAGFKFEYVEFQTIEFTEGSFSSELSSLLAYYAYIILGLDYDSYSKMGGTKYYQKAQEIVNQAQGRSSSGWDGSNMDKDNKYWLVNQLLDPTFKPLREAIYDYHRLGMDKLATEPDEARQKITEALLSLKKVHRDEPSSFLMQIFLTAKRDEIIKIYSKATQSEKDEILALMKEIDGSNYSKYSDGFK